MIFILTLFLPSVSAHAVLSMDLDTIVVTNDRFAQKDYKIASNVTVITQDQIRASNASSVTDLLRSALGVQVYDNGTNRTAVLDIRGFGDTASRNVLVLINGRKINAIDISGPDLQQIALGSVERIEIIRGAGSVLYGDNAVGGVVNIITKKGAGELKGKSGALYSSYGSLGEHAEISGARDKFSYYFYSSYLNQGGYRKNSDELSKDFSARLGYAVMDGLSADLETAWHKDSAGLPGGLLSADLQHLGRRATVNPDDYSSTKDRYIKIGLNAKPVIRGDNFGDISLDFQYRNRDTFDSFNAFGPFNTKRAIDTTGWTGKYVFDRSVFGKEVNFVTGADYYDHTNDIIGSGFNADNITISKKEYGLYEFLQCETWDHFFVNTGTRYNRAAYGFHQHNVIVDQKQTPDKWVNSGGVKYEYAKGSNLHFNWQQTFRFLATDEWYSTAYFPGFGITPGLNLNLKQQSGTQYEAGIKHDFNDFIVAGITPYAMFNRNEIFFDPVTFGNSNYDKTDRFGIEFEQKVDLLKLFQLDVFDDFEAVSSYTYQQARFEKGVNDNKLIPMVPVHEAGQTLRARVFQFYELSLSGKYVGSRYAINDVQNQTSPVKPYTVFDAKIAYKRKNFEIFGGINNLFGRRYYTFVSKSTFSDDKSYFPAPERNFSAGVDFRF